MDLIAFDNARQENIQYNKNGEFVVFCVGGASRDSDNRTRITFLSIARISQVVYYDATDNVGFIRAIVKGDVAYSQDDILKFMSFLQNLNLNYVLHNLVHMTDKDVQDLFSEGPDKITNIATARRLVLFIYIITI